MGVFHCCESQKRLKTAAFMDASIPAASTIFVALHAKARHPAGFCVVPAHDPGTAMARPDGAADPPTPSTLDPPVPSTCPLAQGAAAHSDDRPGTPRVDLRKFSLTSTSGFV
jgi:hypothetical protein